ncbi:MAG: hypothetical protein AB7T06_12990 [Kofleriaceae bacterium]
MSARAPRRSFATPFVLTLAAIPACTVQSAPPPQGPSPAPVAQNETRDHRGDEPRHVNPPGPRPATQQPPPDMTPVANPPRPVDQPAPATGTNDHVKGTANTTSTTVAQTAPTNAPDTARGYRQWTVTRSGTKCQSMVKVHCPDGAMCNPPPPAKYACPKNLDDNGRMDIIQHAAKGDCYVDYGPIDCPPNATCNPPPPQKVACPK